MAKVEGLNSCPKQVTSTSLFSSWMRSSIQESICEVPIVMSYTVTLPSSSLASHSSRSVIR